MLERDRPHARRRSSSSISTTRPPWSARSAARAQEGRIDDTPESIARRLAVYHEQTEPVVEYYRTTGKLVPLHASRSIEDVSEEIEKALDMLDDAA